MVKQVHDTTRPRNQHINDAYSSLYHVQCRWWEKKRTGSEAIVIDDFRPRKHIRSKAESLVWGPDYHHHGVRIGGAGLPRQGGHCRHIHPTWQWS